MSSEDLDVPRRPTTTGSVLPAAPALGAARRLGGARLAVTRLLHGVRHRPAQRPTARLLVLVPAHDDEATVGRTLSALLTQSRVPDRVVLLADRCTDRTEEIARRHHGVTVMRVVENTGGTAGALDQGWRRWQAGHDLVAVVSADTVLAPDCLQQLETELTRTVRPGAVVARYAVDLRLGTTTAARLLLRARRGGPAAFAAAALDQDDVTRVLGGQTALFDADALRRVAASRATRGPWDPGAVHAGAALVRALRGLGRETVVSTAARAHAGPVLTVQRLRDRSRATAAAPQHP